jgi:hypothetical protein
LELDYKWLRKLIVSTLLIRGDSPPFLGDNINILSAILQTPLVVLMQDNKTPR